MRDCLKIGVQKNLKTFTLSSLNLSVYVILLLELCFLFFKLDILPLLLLAISSSIGVMLGSNEVDIPNIFIRKENVVNFKKVLKFILICFIDISLFLCFKMIGFETLKTIFVNVLNTSLIVRFLLYGFVFPLTISYFFTWSYSEEKPITLANAKICINSTLLFLFLGLIVCMYWDKYFILATKFLTIF